jgi:transmembrane sensor
MISPFDPSATRTLQDQAIDWLVKLRDDQLDDRDLDDFAEWLGQAPEHGEAFAVAEQLFNDMVSAACAPAPTETASSAVQASVAAKVIPLARRTAKSAKPSWLAPAIGIAAAWLLAIGLVMPKQSHPFSDYFSDYRTQTGELREIQLSDGSRLLMNTNSSISVDFDTNSRHIVLHHGQVRFTVAKDTQRPFEVVADNLTVRALGTVFDVYKHDDAETSVTVQEHAVAATLAGRDGSTGSIKVAEGQQLNYKPGQPLPRPEPAKLDQATAWQQHRLLINDRPLLELIKELERYRLGRIFIADPALNHLRVSGVFSMDNPESTLTTLSQVLTLKQTRIGPWVVLHR